MHHAEVHITDSKVASNAKAPTKDQIEIKIMAKNRKKPFIVNIGKNEQLYRLAYACSEEFKCNVDKVRLEYVFI